VAVLLSQGTEFDDTYDGAQNTGQIVKGVRIDTGVSLDPGQAIFVSFQGWYNAALDGNNTSAYRWNQSNRSGTVVSTSWGQALIYGANTSTWLATYNNTQGWNVSSNEFLHVFAWIANPPDAAAPLVVPPLQVLGASLDDRFGELSWHWWVLGGFLLGNPFEIPSWGVVDDSFVNPAPRQVLNYRMSGGPATGSTGSDANPVNRMLVLGSAGGMRTSTNPAHAITTGQPDSMLEIDGAGFFDEAATTTLLLKNGGGNPGGLTRRIRHSWGTLDTTGVGQPGPFTAAVDRDIAAAGRQRGLHWGKFTMGQTNLRAAVFGGAIVSDAIRIRRGLGLVRG
jgi:hypothetical protein